jgi:hypothetical protein
MPGKPLNKARDYAAQHGCTLEAAMKALGMEDRPLLSAYYVRIGKAVDAIDKEDEDFAFKLRKTLAMLLANAYRDYNRFRIAGVAQQEELELLHKLAAEVMKMFPLPKQYGRPDTSGLDAPQSAEWLMTETGETGHGESTTDGSGVQSDPLEDSEGECDPSGERKVPATKDL